MRTPTLILALFALAAAGQVRLEVFDTAGRRVGNVGFGEPDLQGVW